MDNYKLSASASVEVQKRDFCEYIDNYIKSTTKFETAKEFLERAKPLSFAVKIVVISGLAGSIWGLMNGGLLGVAVCGGFITVLAFVITHLLSLFKYLKIVLKEYPLPASGVDIDDLTIFLNANLKDAYLPFGKWERVNVSKVGKDGVGCELRGKMCARIIIASNKACTHYYRIDAPKLSPAIFIAWGPRGVHGGNADPTANFRMYRNAYLIIPILRAAMEYYLKTKNP